MLRMTWRTWLLVGGIIVVTLLAITTAVFLLPQRLARPIDQAVVEQLTEEAQQSLTALVCRGLPTKEIAAKLYITPNPIQDHLKSIFDKTGVSSRRELVATILQEQHLPRAMAGAGIAPGERGWSLTAQATTPTPRSPATALETNASG